MGGKGSDDGRKGGRKREREREREGDKSIYTERKRERNVETFRSGKGQHTVCRRAAGHRQLACKTSDIALKRDL